MTPGALRPASYTTCYEQAPDIVDARGTRNWIIRSGNMVLAISHVSPGSVLERTNNPDESMVLLPAGVNAEIEAASGTVSAAGDSLTIVPPGPGRVIAHGPGHVVRIFSSRASDLAAVASNTELYADGAPELEPIVPWPPPIGGFRLLHYPLANFESPDPSPLKMRVFRSTNLMINLFLPWSTPRDETRLSPHAHTDFEQISLALEGTFAHHLRYPWTPDKTTWREDAHLLFGSPSALVIPARVIHTSHNIGSGVARLVDIFAPPRRDFLRKDGFVLNARDYPPPS